MDVVTRGTTLIDREQQKHCSDSVDEQAVLGHCCCDGHRAGFGVSRINSFDNSSV